jgi:metal-responsive CopG/Arc/MetJ family transcriptional regulator
VLLFRTVARKLSISLSEGIAQELDRRAKAENLSRSTVVARALRVYLGMDDSDQTVEELERLRADVNRLLALAERSGAI